MGKIDELIKQMCPEGVKWVTLGDYCNRLKGTPITAGKMKEIQCNTGDIRVFAGGKTVVNAYEKDIPNANVIREPAILVQSRGVIDVVYYDNPFTFKNEMWAYTTSCQCTTKFIYYFLKGVVPELRIKATSMGAFPQISIPDTNNLSIPLPPLPIQEAIVEILDKFDRLSAELQAELQARKTQYEYYRNQLLTRFAPDQQVKEYSLGELGTFTRGTGLQKSDFVEEGFPCIHYGQVHTFYKTFADKTKSFTSLDLAKKLKKAKKGDLIIATTSEDVCACCKATAWLGDTEVAISGDSYMYSHSQNPKYMAYLFQTEEFAKQKSKVATGAKVVRVSGEAMAKFRFMFPSLSEQARIVSILDKFEALVNDLSQGLPAEIEAVKEQYEYYRNKLLTFDKIS